MIPETTREAVLEAMERFDRELRDSPEWANWEQKESHKYAIEQNGHRYPVKKTVSIASNTPVGSFSGGDEANTYITKLGFPVVVSSIAATDTVVRSNGERPDRSSA